MNSSLIVSVLGAALHLGFAVGEIVPLKAGLPLILASVLKKKHVQFTDEAQRKLVVAVVQNAGAYNLIVGLGFLFAAFPIGLGGEPLPEAAEPLRAFFFAAAILLGLVGLSLSKLTLVQGLLGVIGLATLLWS